MWRSMLHLEDRPGKRIDDTNKRINGVNESLTKRVDGVGEKLGMRIDGIDGRLRTIESTQAGTHAEIKGKLGLVAAYILGRNDTRIAPAE